MGGLRRGPGGPAEWRVGKLRQAALSGAQAVLEEDLAIGLQPISHHCALLLGRAARPWSHPSESGDWEAQWSDWWSPEIQDAVGGRIRTLPLVMCQEPVWVPKVIQTSAPDLKVTPAVEEMVRLEGHYWAKSWAKGRGSVYRLDRFGRRGEGVLVPDFCSLEEPQSSTCIHFGRERQDVSWLPDGLLKLAASVNLCRKMPVMELIEHIQSSEHLNLLVPVTQLTFTSDASIKAFSRATARRFPFYVESVEMGARLEISIVPPLKTRSGEPDYVDVEELEQIGAQLFPLNDMKGLLCIRRFGGPPLQIAAFGAHLKDICDYLRVGWVDSLFAAPKTWERLFVNVQPCGSLEASLGHFPGRGLFTKQLESPCCGCGEMAIGSEVLEETMEVVPVCRDCGAFVRGSEGFFSKQGLSQHTSRPPQELIGSFDSQLDDTLRVDREDANDMTSWAEATVPEDCAVLAAGGIISLKPPKRGWPEEVKRELHRQLQMVIGCAPETLHITQTSTEADSPNLMVTFVMSHPAILHAGRERRENEAEWADPKMPLVWYRQLESQLKRLAENQAVRSQWTKTVKDRAVPLLFISDNKRVVLPSSLFLLKMKHDEPTEPAEPVEATEPEAAEPAEAAKPQPPEPEHANSRRASSIPGDVGHCIDQIRERLAPKDGIERRQSLQAPEVQRRMSQQQRRATVAELCRPEGLKQLEAEVPFQKLFEMREDGNHREVDPSMDQAASSSSSSSAASAEEYSDQVRESNEAETSAEGTDSGVQDAGVSMENLQPVASPVEPEEKTTSSVPAQHSKVEDLKPKAEGRSYQFALSLLDPEPSMPFVSKPVKILDDPVVEAVLRFRPSLEQLSLRIRDLVAAEAWEGQAAQLENLLRRWGGSDAAWPIASRASCHFQGQSALDMSVKACNYQVTHVLLKYMPKELGDEIVSLLNGHNPLTGHSLLYAAVRYSNRHTALVVQELILRRADVHGPGSSPSSGSENVLVSCVRRADLSLIQRILDYRASMQVTGDDGKTLLQTAVCRGDASVLGCLLQANCDISTLDRCGRSALVTALRQDRSPFVLIHMLIDARCDTSSVDVDGMQPLAHAVGLQDLEIYKSLLLRRADPNAIAIPAIDKHSRMLHFAAKAQDEVMLRCLLEAEADPNLKGKHDRTVLHLAIGLQLSQETITFILEKQADPNASAGLRAGGETPLRMAVQIDKPTDAPTVKLLLGARADPTVCNLAGCSAKFAANLRGSGNPSVPKMVGTRNRQSGTRQSGFSEARSGDTLTHPMHLASTWRKARFRPRHTPRLIHTQEVTDFDPLFPFNLPPINKKLRETR